VRDEDIRGWSALCQLRVLRLAGNWYLSEGAISKMLERMEGMRELKLDHFQGGSAALLLGPLQRMTGLQALSLVECRLEGVGAVPGLREVLEGAPRGLRRLALRRCGAAPMICQAASAVLPRFSSNLERFELTVDSRVSDPAMAALAAALSSCCQLQKLRVDVASSTINYFGVPGTDGDVFQWEELSSLARLRTLSIAASLGWTQGAMAAVASAATGLRRLSVQDGIGAVEDGWLTALAPHLRRLQKLELSSCRRITREGGVAALLALPSLVEVRALRCPGLSEEGAVAALRAGLPALRTVNAYD
jgi:hypothetical protein